MFGGLFDGMFRLLERATELPHKAVEMEQGWEDTSFNIETQRSARMLRREFSGGGTSRGRTSDRAQYPARGWHSAQS